jgi:hypothetical protein
MQRTVSGEIMCHKDFKNPHGHYSRKEARGVQLMRVKDFVPTHYQSMVIGLSLLIEVKHENGEDFIYSRYSTDGSHDHVVRSVVRINGYGHPYFVRNRQRYFLSDFLRLHI